MGLDLIPEDLRRRYTFDERGHATAILAADFQEEFAEILGCLGAFRLKKSDILRLGGARSQIPITIDGCLAERGWRPKAFDIQCSAPQK